MWLFSRIWKSGSSSSGYAPEFTILASKIPKKTIAWLVYLNYFLSLSPQKITNENSYISIWCVKLLLVKCLEKQFSWFKENVLTVSGQGIIWAYRNEYAFWDFTVR